MRWLLAGYCGLALLTISVATDNDQWIKQQPWFYGITTGNAVKMLCLCNSKKPVTVNWYKAPEYDSEENQRKEIKKDERIEMHDRNDTKGAYLHVNKLRIEDSGVYFCKINNKWGPGTQVHVVRSIERSKAQHRTNMKDGLIVLQGLLLAVLLGALVLHKQNLYEKRDSIYEEPETDHIYEGLAIETCGGGLYEELSIYAQAEGAEAPWE